MKKRILMAMIIGVSLSVGAAFAQHPGGLGIGAIIQYGGPWNDLGAKGVNGIALSLKLPKMPYYWGINLDLFHDDWFGISVSGDKYIFDKPLVPNINLGWFLGLGLYGGIGFYTGSADITQFNIGAGGRVPVGLTWNHKQKFEVFLDIAPSLGIGIGIGNVYGTGDGKENPLWLDGGWAGDFGFRVWL